MIEKEESNAKEIEDKKQSNEESCNKKKVGIVKLVLVPFLILLFIYVVCLIILVQQYKIRCLESDVLYYSGDFVLNGCPLCGGEAVLSQVGDYFCIECDECELKTAYCNSAEKLVEYWNDRPGA